MAETVNPPVTPEGQTLTPNPTEVQQVIDQVAANAALGDPNVPLEIKLKTGQVYKGTSQEVIAALARGHEENSEYSKRQKDELARVKAELESVKQQIPRAAPAPDSEYRAERYYELFQEDPLKAQAYLDRFDPIKQQMAETLQNVRNRSELENFQSRVNFYPGDEQKKAFADEFVASGLEPNAANYELVYWRMQASNKLAPPAISRIDGQQAPPPSMRGGTSAGSPADFDLERFKNLPASQMAEVIGQLKQRGWR